MSTINYLQIFNQQFIDFVDDVQKVFPDDVDILTTKNALLVIKKNNPKMLAKIWKLYIVDKYEIEIEKGNIDFLINKDYSSDIQKMDSSNKIMETINRLKEPIKNMSNENQKKTIKYIQNLSKLSKLII